MVVANMRQLKIGMALARLLRPKAGGRRRRTVRRRRVGGSRRYGMRGSGFWGSLWSGIKKGANWVKDQKLISKGLGAIGNPYAQTASRVASTLGLGRRRRVARGGRRRVGRPRVRRSRY